MDIIEPFARVQMREREREEKKREGRKVEKEGEMIGGKDSVEKFVLTH